MRLVVLAVTLVACGVPGTPIVEDVVLACLGVLWRHGYFTAWALPVAFVGVLAGDLVTYGFGRRYGMRLLDHAPDSLDRAISLWYVKHDVLTVLVLRIGPGLRMPGFLLAGATRMPLGKFVLVDAIGALVSVPAFVGLGWLLAGAFDRVERAILVIGGVAAAVLLGVVAVFVRRVQLARRRSVP